MNAETFNARYPVGTPVFAYPGARPEDIPSARRLVTRTRTEAKSVGLDRDGVVWVEGQGAYISLTHIDPVPESVWQAAKEAEAAAVQQTTTRADIYGGLTVALNDGPINTAYGRDINGKSTALLVIGEGARTLGISVTDSSLAALDELEAAVAELKAWALRQQQLKSLPEVA